MKKPEILAPAGSQEQLLAAVRCGADAVYLGAKGFNARKKAENFAEGDLSAAVSFCHGRGVRVYVTLNTLVRDDEMEAALDTIREIAQSGADGVIVQDLGIAKLLRNCCPTLPLHASTQMTIHNAAGARAAMALGFTRLVAARELSLSELQALADTGVELEAFVHGALCMCMSGCCYLSAMLGGRSGNRGLCAQPCRLDFRAGTRPFALSLKDMSHVERIDALAGAGVCSLKIEGRMKRPEYVAAAVSACRAVVDGRKPDLEALRAVFSRSGFTDGYLDGKRDLTMFGNRTKDEVLSTPAVLGKLAALYRAERQSLPVDMALFFQAGEASRLELTCEGEPISVQGPVPETARTRPMDAEYAQQCLAKTGNTPFYLRGFRYEGAEGLTLPVAVLNHMRREGLAGLLERRSRPRPHAMEARILQLEARERQSEPALYGCFESFAQAAESHLSKIILPLEEIEKHSGEAFARFGERLICELPALIFPHAEADYLRRLIKLRDMGLMTAAVENIGALHMAREAGLKLHGGHGLNILNSAALSAYVDLGLDTATASFELQIRKVKALKSPLPLGILGYGRLPLMRMRTCPMQTPTGCGNCDGKPSLRDRRGVDFPVLCHQRQFTTLLNSVPLYLADQDMRGLDFLTLYFTLESPVTCRSIEQAYWDGLPAEGAYTRGLYYRELQ